MPQPNEHIAHFRALLSSGDLKAVFKQLPAHFPPEAPEVNDLIVLEGQFLINQRDEMAGLAERDAIRITRAQLTQALNDLVNRLAELGAGTQAAATSLDEQLRSIRALFIDADRLPHAFSRLEVLLETHLPEQMPQFSSLWAVYENTRKDYRITNTIDRDKYMRTFAATVAGLQNLLQEVKEAAERITGKDVQLEGELARVNCDRKKILQRFLRTFEEHENAGVPFHLYLLSHQTYGQAESLVRRLVTQLHHEYPQVKYSGFQQTPIHRIDILAGDDEDDSRFSLRKGFNRGLRPEVNGLEAFLQRIDQDYPQYSRSVYLPFALQVKMPGEIWAKAGQPGLRWFLREFCGCAARQARVPVLFLTVELEETTPAAQPSGWRGLFGRSKEPAATPIDNYQALESLLPELPAHTVLLPPLNRVVEADLHDWYHAFESNERRREEKVQALVQQLGPSPDGWHMADVEALLEQVIDELQNAAYNI